jgi:hypothetical protein
MVFSWVGCHTIYRSYALQSAARPARHVRRRRGPVPWTHERHTADAWESGGAPTTFSALSPCATRVWDGRADHRRLPNGVTAVPVPMARPRRYIDVCEPPFNSPAYKKDLSSTSRAPPLAAEPLPPHHWHPAPNYLAGLISQPPNHPSASPKVP